MKRNYTCAADYVYLFFILYMWYVFAMRIQLLLRFIFFTRAKSVEKKNYGIFVNIRFWIDLNDTQVAHTANHTWPYGIRSAYNFIYVHTSQHHAAWN